MVGILSRLTDRMSRVFPEGSPRRKLLTLIALVLIFEGLSVLILFSYIGYALGIASIIIGATILLLLPAKTVSDESKSEETADEASPTPGLRLVAWFERAVGGKFGMMIAGTAVILMVIIFNHYASVRSELGDLDVILILFGGILLIFPHLGRNYRIEASFALLFMGFVVLLLALPQVVIYLAGDAGAPAGNWYVHYMLAAPFSGMLDALGIESSSSGNYVTIQFADGSFTTLGISAYCAGLYSFSIFLAAFFSFVLVYERLSNRTLALVLGIGLLVAYLGNLIRMLVIGVVGYYYGLDALLWAHENVGWIIFLSWSAIFWYVLLNYTSKQPKVGRAAERPM